jgi:hypothetical protein
MGYGFVMRYLETIFAWRKFFFVYGSVNIVTLGIAGFMASKLGEFAHVWGRLAYCASILLVLWPFIILTIREWRHREDRMATFYRPRYRLIYTDDEVLAQKFGNINIMSVKASPNAVAAVELCEKMGFEYREQWMIGMMVLHMTHADDAMLVQLSL